MATEWKMENDCVRFAQEWKSFLKEIPQFSIFNCQFSIAQLLAKLEFDQLRWWGGEKIKKWGKKPHKK